MKELFDYINSNTFLSTTIGVIVGWLLNFIGSMYFHRREKKDRIEESKRQEKIKQYDNKPELFLDENNSDVSPDIEIFIAKYCVTYDVEKKYKVLYSKNINNKKKHLYMDFTFKNIGKTDINNLDIISSNKKDLLLVDYDYLDKLVENETISCDYLYDRKIRTGEKIKVRIYFEKEKQPYLLFSSTLAILFEDQSHNYWEQPFFYEESKLYPPYLISYKDYLQRVNADYVYRRFEEMAINTERILNKKKK